MQYDCHVEVFDPVRWRPAEKDVARACAIAVDLRAFLRTRNTRHAVVVQPLDYCGTHGCLVDAVRTVGANTRAVGTLSRYVDGAEIDALNHVGMRGTRVVMQSPNWDKAIEDIEDLHDALPPLWHIELTGSWRWLAALGPRLARLSPTFVAVCPDIWHIPFAPADTMRFLWWLEMGNVYLKLINTEPMRCQRTLLAAQPELTSALSGTGDRLLWGSGWPNLMPHRLPVTSKPENHLRTVWPPQAFDLNARTVYGFND